MVEVSHLEGPVGIDETVEGLVPRPNLLVVFGLLAADVAVGRGLGGHLLKELEVVVGLTRDGVLWEVNIALAFPLVGQVGEQLILDGVGPQVEANDVPGATGRALDRQLVAHVTTVAYDPDATAPRWEKFISEITEGDAEVANFLQEFFGYALTGSVSEHKSAILYGSGCNGKSVFLDVVREILGSYAVTSSPELIMETRGESHPTIIAALEGKRLSLISELPTGKHLDTGRFKALTGGDAIVARAMRQDFRSFAPHHKFVIATNFLPKIDDSSEGFWRRVVPVHFPASFLGREDSGLTAKLLAEGPGVLNWLLAGLRRYQVSGLTLPAASLAALREYRQGEDVVQDFVADALVKNPMTFLSSGRMHEAFCSWASAHKARTMSAVNLGRELAKRGIVSKHTRAGSRFEGWDLQVHSGDFGWIKGEMDELADDGTLSEPKVAPLQTKKA